MINSFNFKKGKLCVCAHTCVSMCPWISEAGVVSDPGAVCDLPDVDAGIGAPVLE